MKELEGDNKQSIARDLRKLSELLVTYGFIIDSSPLEEAAQKCLNNPNDDIWYYSMSLLEFREIDETIASTIPQNAEEFKIRLSVESCGNYYSHGSVQDPLQSIVGKGEPSFDIEIKAILLSEEKGADRDLLASWHLDRHISEDGDNEGKYIHPWYHFTFGGKAMEESDKDFGESLILPMPRVPHPPMDIALGVDFILHHFFRKEERKSITEESEYQKIVQKSQYRLWKPYFLTMARHWIDRDVEYNFDDDNFSPSKLYPNLIM